MSTQHNRDYLKEKLVQIIPETRNQLSQFRKEYDNTIIDNVTVKQFFGGARDVKCLYHEPSILSLGEGIKFRGMTCDQLRDNLKFPNISKEPLPEAVFWLLLTGQVPSVEEVEWLSAEWARRAELPYYLVNIINSFPDNLHPMAQLSASVTLLSRFSKFSLAYNAGGIPKTELWKPMYEDCMNLIAKLPVIAALIYRNSYHNGTMEPINTNYDWSKNFTRMLGINNDRKFIDYMRLYLSIHSDHEGGNVSCHTAYLVGSALSDIYLSFSAAVNGLAGPLHGRANQEVVEWIREMTTVLGDANLNNENITKYCKKAIQEGVIPGFGHAILRITDPRYTIIKKFADENLPNNPAIDTVDKLNAIVSEILQAGKKAKNPQPNVDCISGTVLNQFNLTELNYYTVPFAVSRSLGISAGLIWARALSMPIERVKSLDLNEITAIVKEKTK